MLIVDMLFIVTLMLLMMNDKSQQILSGVEVIYGPVSYSFQIFLRFNFTLSLCLSYEL